VRAAAAAAGLLAVASVSVTGAPATRTVRVGRDPIAAFTQDGGMLAWLGVGGADCNSVRVLTAGGSRLTAPQPADDSMTCHWDVEHGHPELALAAGSSSALWTLHEGGGVSTDFVMAAGLGGREVRVDRLAHDSDGTGLWLGGLAGSGTTLAYSVADVEYANEMACLSGGSCRRKIAGGGVHVVANGTERLLPGTKPALAISTAAGRVAYVQAAAGATGPVPSARLPLRIVDAKSGQPVCSIRPGGEPLAVSLASDVLAVLTRSGDTDRISWYDATRCTRLGRIRVVIHTAPELAASNRLVVYRVGRVLRGIALPSRRVRTLVRAAVPPVGFSLAGRSLAWAENRATGGRIRVLGIR
jgi:hypothetical protein